MRECISVILAFISAVVLVSFVCSTMVLADQGRESVTGKIYDLSEDGKYELSVAQEIDSFATRFFVKGDFSSATESNGLVSFAVNKSNLSIMIDDHFGIDLFEEKDAQKWHIIPDKTRVVDGIELNDSIGSGAIVVQTSRDGKAWITVDTETDIYNKGDSINNRSSSSENMNAFYSTTNVQLTNGCYYRIIVAYKMEREIDPSQFLFLSVKNKEEKERIEVYQFYAFDPHVNRTEALDTRKAYEFSDVCRVDDQDGFENPVLIKSDDPHIDWLIGRFYVSGYTDVRMDGDVPVFLKVPGDRTALWFVLEQELDKCNGDSGIKVNNTNSGSDVYFGSSTINNFGRGALIIRKTDKQHQKERQIYTNYLEASATVGANTRVDLFEEGDYEVALDYQLNYEKPFVFGTTAPKTLAYRVFFKFKVRNGDISAFLRDVDSKQFITNGNVALHGFYIDVANSQYLTMTIKREMLSESLDGLIEDTKFSGVAIDGRKYTEEGIYTVTIKNLATEDSITKRVYVGDQDILLVHMKTGRPISEIKNELLASGAYIDEHGHLIDQAPLTEEGEEPESETPTLEIAESEGKAALVDASTEDPSEVKEEYPVSENITKQSNQITRESKIFAIISVAAVIIFSVSIAFVKKIKKKSVKEDQQE